MMNDPKVHVREERPSLDLPSRAPGAQEVLALTPHDVWRKFAALSSMPRVSGNEGQVREAIKRFADDRQLKYLEDATGNITIQVPGRGAGKQAPCVAIQAHMDMVGTKTESALHDFHTDPIALAVSQRELRDEIVDVVCSNGTTLGADNGIGLCMALALVDDDSLIDRPPLEIVCTVLEEVGLIGANKLGNELLQAEYLINLDTEDEGEIYISCAGSVDLLCTSKVERGSAPHDAVAVLIEVGELPGGHSGVMIHGDIVNPIKVVPRFLRLFQENSPSFQLAQISGGNARNAIPKSVQLSGWCSQSDLQRCKDTLGALWCAAVREVFPTSPEVGEIRIKDEEGAVPPPLTKESLDPLCRLIAELPHGVIAFSTSVSGLVETSNNVAQISISEDLATIQCMARSSDDSALTSVREKIEMIASSTGYSLVDGNESPGWLAEPDSRLLKITTEEYESYLRTFNPTQEISIKAVHAGLECGAFKRINKDLQMVSIGPDIRGAHTPEEFVSVRSVARLYDVVKRVLSRLAC